VNDNVKVMDFGIARLMSDKHLTRTGAKLGTLFYMSPEQVLAEKDIDHRTDIYSAGIVLYEMLTGKLPFSADTDSDYVIMKEIAETRTPDPREVYSHISDQTVATLHKATQKQREQRYQNCDEILNGCQANSSGISSISKSKPIPVIQAGTVQQRSMQNIPDDMVLVEGGSFDMGSDKGEKDETPMHAVSIASFYIGRYVITQEEWASVMGSNPSDGKGDKLPVVRVSWFDAVNYCNERSIKEGLQPCYTIDGNKITCNWAANGYRLPTEAEWEYAARGGNKSKGYKYSGFNNFEPVKPAGINFFLAFAQAKGDHHLVRLFIQLGQPH